MATQEPHRHAGRLLVVDDATIMRMRIQARLVAVFEQHAWPHP